MTSHDDTHGSTYDDTGRPHPTTTHAAPGSGHPKIFVSTLVDDGTAPREVPITSEELTIGSGPGVDLELDGLLPHHVTIYHDVRDEYRVRALGAVGGGSASDDGDRALRTGARIEVDPWVLTFWREERADHGRPYGGRQGGEFSEGRTQAPRPADLAAGLTPSVPPGTEVDDDAPGPITD